MRALHKVLPARSRLTPIEKWHLTLLFLGELAPEPVAGVLAEVPSPGPFELRLGGGGRFGAAAWVGVGGDLGRLGELREGLRDALALGGFPSDDRPFRPHLTVSYHADEALRQALARYTGQPWPVTGFALVRSAEGRYERLASWRV